MLILYGIFKVYIGLWNIAYYIFIILGCFEVFAYKENTKEKLKLFCAFLLATIIAYFSCSRMTITFTVNENLYNNSDEIAEYDNNDTDNVEYNYTYDKNLADQLMKTYEEVYRVSKNVVKKYNEGNYDKSDNIDINSLIYCYCYCDVETEIGIISDAGEVMEKKILLNSAFDDYEKLFFLLDFEGEFYNMVKEYNIDTDIFSDDQKEKLKYIVCDEDGNLFINPSYFITKTEKNK